MKQVPKVQLREKGLKATPARLAILTAFASGCDPMNAESIYNKLVKKSATKDIDLVTVYRTLASFEAEGILIKVDLRKDSLYYELAEGHHHHLICKQCGMLEEFEVCDIDAVSKKILARSRSFKSVTGHSFELFGMCNVCVRRG